MTQAITTLPVMTSTDVTAGQGISVQDGSTEGAANPFGQLLGNLFVSQPVKITGKNLPLELGLELPEQDAEQGKLLPLEGQMFSTQPALSPLVMQQLAASHNVLDSQVPQDGDEVAMLGLFTRHQAKQDNASQGILVPAQGQHSSQSADASLLSANSTDLLQQKMQAQFAILANKPAIKAEQLPSANTESSISSLTANLSSQLLSVNGSAQASHNSVRTDMSTMLPAMQVSPQNAAWSQHLGERIQWMVTQKMQKAEIRLDPPDLGSLDVRIVVQKDQAHVSFVSPHLQVRDALEAAIPRLREMLNDQGMNLVNVDVGQHGFSGQQQQAMQDAEAETHVSSSGQVAQDMDEVVEERNDVISMGNGLLDTYV